MSQFTRRVRFNWGFWDGKDDAEHNRFARWCKPGQTSGHPFDLIYGQGYWAGCYDTSGATISTPAWKARRSLHAPSWA